MKHFLYIFVCLIFLISTTGPLSAIPRPQSSIDDLMDFDPMDGLNISSEDLLSDVEPSKEPEERVFLYPMFGEHAQQLLKGRIIDNTAFYQGDIALGAVHELTDASDDQSIRDSANKIYVAGYGLTNLNKSSYLWPKGIIPYTIDESLESEKQIIFDAVSEWNEKTNITLVHYELEKDYLQSQFKNYEKLWRIHFMVTNGRSCFSFVGLRKTTKYTDTDYNQVISLATGLSYGTPLHEIGHTIGLWHEHNRPDRNQFIKVMADNIQDNEEDQYDIGNNNSGTMTGDYDYKSIMHYRDDCFNIDGKQTFQALSYPGNQHDIGRTNTLSDGDIEAVNAMYPFKAWHPGEFISPCDTDEEDEVPYTPYDSGTTNASTYTGSSGNSGSKPTTVRRKKTTFSEEEKKHYGALVAKRLPSNRPARYKNLASIDCTIKRSGGLSLIECALTLSDPDNPSDTITYVGSIHNNGTEYYVMYVKKRD